MVKTKRRYLAVASAKFHWRCLIWLLTLHPAASGRVYAAWWRLCLHGVDVAAHFVDGVKLTLYDWTGALIALCILMLLQAGAHVGTYKSILSIRYEEASADKGYSISSFVNHSWRKYTPFL
ncbi:hypothetical protein [Escherichia coli]|uniref:hypothetical protein n=1 Tax=Escherichia coli TaxID=562 RepID=UPI002237BAE4|nr:hypothetical protein [Escherichia coli]MCW7160605.1 hypothetical protein [Escherichia coli]